MDDCVLRAPCTERGRQDHQRARFKASLRGHRQRERWGSVPRGLRKIESLYEENKKPGHRTRKPQLNFQLVRHIPKNLGDRLHWKVLPTYHFRTQHNEEVIAAVVQAVKDAEPNWSFHQVRKIFGIGRQSYWCDGHNSPSATV
ncbi:hypothetical protein OJAV_G00143090 [Oryzias javanicus]|uniref:Uncharacterized protein n=1 Tax=Oryzias javanicus TaxID=123683 RepID=A0A437CQ61_ORYJA|nr:hypothetical protein OJAV_G00143090 [Oryzias javanicus]